MTRCRTAFFWQVNNMPRQLREDALERVKEIILIKVHESSRRLSPSEIRKEITRNFACDKKTVSAAIQALVAQKALMYTNQFGTTFLEPSFSKPVYITDRMILKPPNLAYSGGTEKTVINIAPGAAFGVGEHPTTRLALKGLSYAVENRLIENGPETRMLDIGTGTGILAIAALLMGIGKAVASDIDPCARSEAAHNVALNGLSERIGIVGALTDLPHQRFSLVTANLRAPTLQGLKPLITACLRTGGTVVLSGIKQDECADIKQVYADERMTCRWEKMEKDWAGLVFISS